MPLTSFSSGQTISSSAMNANFALCVLTDTARTVTVTHTWSASQSFTAGVSVTGSITMLTAASKLVPGATSFSHRNNADSADNLLITDAGVVTVRAGLTVTAGGLTVTAGGLTVTSGNTVLQALSVADTGLAISGGFILNNEVRFTSALSGGVCGIVNTGETAGGTMHFMFRGTANSGTWSWSNGTGAVSTRMGLSGAGVLTVSAGVVLTAGALTFGAAASKIVPGATSLSLRNTADSADNLIVTDAGNVTIRGNLAVSGVVSGGVVAVAQTSDISQTTTGAANTSLAVTLGTNQTWKIDFDIVLSCNNTGGVVLSFTAPAGATGRQSLMGPLGSATAYTNQSATSFAGSTWSTYNSSASPVYVRVSCYVVTAGTGGAFTLQYNSLTGGQTSAIYTGSTMLATRIS